MHPIPDHVVETRSDQGSPHVGVASQHEYSLHERVPVGVKLLPRCRYIPVGRRLRHCRRKYFTLVPGMCAHWWKLLEIAECAVHAVLLMVTLAWTQLSTSPPQPSMPQWLCHPTECQHLAISSSAGKIRPECQTQTTLSLVYQLWKCDT